MKACVVKNPLDVQIEDLPIPEPKDDEVLLRVTVAGICTNDVRDYKGSKYTYPRIGGHEYAGVIERLGKDVDTRVFRIGQKVVNYIIDECGVCYNCKHNHEIFVIQQRAERHFIMREVYPVTLDLQNI